MVLAGLLTCWQAVPHVPLQEREAAIAQREAEIRAKIDELSSFQVGSRCQLNMHQGTARADALYCTVLSFCCSD